MVQCPRSSGTTRQAKRYKPLTALTLLRPGVVFAKGVVFGYVGVQEPQRVLRNVFGCHHFVIADDIGESHSRELLLGVGFYRVELELCRGEKQQLLKAGFKVFSERVQKSCSHFHKFRVHTSIIVLWGREAQGIQHIVMVLGVFCIQNDWCDLSMEINCNISLTNLGCVAFLTFFQIM